MIRIVIEYEQDQEHCDIYCCPEMTADQLQKVLYLMAETVEECDEEQVH